MVAVITSVETVMVIVIVVTVVAVVTAHNNSHYHPFPHTPQLPNKNLPPHPPLNKTNPTPHHIPVPSNRLYSYSS